MLKLTFALMRRPELTRAAFQTYWREQHAPLVASVREVLRIRRYVQLHSLPADISEPIRASRHAPQDFDGVAQLWWDNLDDMTAAITEPKAVEAGRMLLEDERTFIDLERSPLWWGEESVIF